jgi:hypothetical protein
MNVDSFKKNNLQTITKGKKNHLHIKNMINKILNNNLDLTHIKCYKKASLLWKDSNENPKNNN